MKQICVLIFIFCISAPFASATQQNCVFILGVDRLDQPTVSFKVTNVLEILKDFFNSKESLEIKRVQLISGLVEPGWQEVELVENTGKKLHEALSDTDELQIEFILKQLKDNSEVNGWANKISSADLTIDANSYGPNGYGLRKHTRDALLAWPNVIVEVLLKKLPLLPKDKQKINEISAAKKLLERQKNILSGLYPLEYAPEQLRSKQKDHPAFMQLSNGEFEFAIARPENGRWWVPKVGFHNQFVTSSSRGALDKDLRNRVESIRLGMNIDEYRNLSPDLKAKYGFLFPSIDRAYEVERNHYGPDIYFMKKEAVKDRLTWTLGDSLNDFSSRLADDQSQYWNEVFVPWQNYELMSPFYSESKPLISLHRKSQITDLPIPLNTALEDRSYLELQLWGPLQLNMIHSFGFYKNPPEGEFLQELLRHDIIIYDFRDLSVGPPPRWTPKSE